MQITLLKERLLKTLPFLLSLSSKADGFKFKIGNNMDKMDKK